MTLHWDGQTWSRVPSPSPATCCANELDGAVALSAHNAWAVGTYTDPETSRLRPLILHWSDTGWHRMKAPTGRALSAVDGTRSRNVWAVGRSGGRHRKTLTLHWDGTGWSRIASPNPSSSRVELNGLSVRLASDVWAVDNYVDEATGVWKTLILHWNGVRWSRT